MEERFRAEVSPVQVSQTKTGRYVFKGVASTVGNVDRMKRCFLPGAFGSASSKVPLLAHHDETKVLGSSGLKPNGMKLLHESSINPKAALAEEMTAMLADGDIPATSISWLSNERYFGWSDLKRKNPERAKQASAAGVPQHEDVIYFGSAEIVENSIVAIPANDRALIGAASLVGELDRGFIESMREVASLGVAYRDTAAGSRHNATDRASIQTAHDALVDLGATCTVTTSNSENFDDQVSDEQGDRDLLNAPPPPLGGWTDYMNPRGSADLTDEAVVTEQATAETDEPQLPAELASLEIELEELAGRFSA
jgi:phage head maturation protease